MNLFILYNKKNISFLVVLIISLLCSCASYQPPKPPTPRITISPKFNGNEYNRFAVLSFDNTRRNRPGRLRQVEDEFMRAIIENGYTVVARSDVKNLLKEQQFQGSSLTEKQLAKIGQILNVPAVVIVTVNNIDTSGYNPIIRRKGDHYYATTANLSARIIGAANGEILWISSYTGTIRYSGRKSDAPEMQVLAQVAKVVASGFPPKAY